MCVLSVELRLKALPHWLHLCGFSCEKGRAHNEAKAPARGGHLGGTLKGHGLPGRGKGSPCILSPTPSLRHGVLRGWGAELDPGATYLGVDNFVSAERAGLAEAFAADFAHERSGSGVDRHVAGEVIVSIKHLWEDTRGLVVCPSARV